MLTKSYLPLLGDGIGCAFVTFACWLLLRWSAPSTYEDVCAGDVKWDKSFSHFSSLFNFFSAWIVESLHSFNEESFCSLDGECFCSLDGERFCMLGDKLFSILGCESLWEVGGDCFSTPDGRSFCRWEGTVYWLCWAATCFKALEATSAVHIFECKDSR